MVRKKPINDGKTAPPPHDSTGVKSNSTVIAPENGNITEDEKRLDELEIKFERPKETAPSEIRPKSTTEGNYMGDKPDGDVRPEDEFKEILKDCLGKDKRGINSMTEVFFYGDVTNPIFLWEVMGDANVSPADRKLVLLRYYKKTYNALKGYTDKTGRTLEEVVDAGFGINRKKNKNKEGDEGEGGEDNEEPEKKKKDKVANIKALLGVGEDGMEDDALEILIDRKRLENERRRAEIEKIRAETKKIENANSETQQPQPQMVPMQVPTYDKEGKVIGQQTTMMPWNPYMMIAPPYPVGGGGGNAGGLNAKDVLDTVTGLTAKMYEVQLAGLKGQIDSMKNAYDGKIASMSPEAQAESYKRLKDIFGGFSPDQFKAQMDLEMEKLKMLREDRAIVREDEKLKSLMEMGKSAIDKLADVVGKPVGEAMGEFARERARQIGAAQGASQQAGAGQPASMGSGQPPPSEFPPEVGPRPPLTPEQEAWLKRRADWEAKNKK